MNNLPFPTRRTFIGGACAAGILPRAAIAASVRRLYAGTYTNRGGAGFVPLNHAGTTWQAGTASAAIRNASFGVAAPPIGVRYLLDEQKEGSLGIYDASLRQIGTRPTRGADPCHAALSADRSLLAVANYSSGSVALWRLDRATGLPRGEAQLIRHEGRGPNSERQAEPHAHWVGFTTDMRVLHSVDLGADAVFAHHLDPATATIRDTSIAFRAEPGSGPRHLARHPRLPVAYLVTELANTVTTLQARPDGTFTARGVTSTLPTGFGGSSAAAHIAINRAGTRLYVSNRGHDSVAVFAIGADGALRSIQHVACGGHWPRFFLLLEDRGEMLVANERSGGIASLRIARDGSLHPTGRSVAVPGAVFLTD